MRIWKKISLLLHLLLFYLRFSRPYLFCLLITAVYMCLPLCSYYPNEHGVTSCQTSVRIDWLFQIYNYVVHFSPPLVVIVKLRVSSIPSILLIADIFFFQILIFIFMMKYFIWIGLYDRIQQSHDIQLYGLSIIIALIGDVQPRIRAPFPYLRPWSVKVSLTDRPSCWIHLAKPRICGLSSILHCRKNGPSE
jgi:hypothetical protein